MGGKRRSKLEEYQPIISDWHQLGLSQQELLDRIAEELQIVISLRQLKVLLRRWGLRANGSTDDLERLRPRITQWYLMYGYSAIQIAARLESLGVSICARTVERKLQSWQVQKQIRIDVEEAPLLRAQIYHLFVNCAYSDELILSELQETGHFITINQLRRIRKALGLTFRINSEQWEQVKHTARTRIQEELDSGLIDSYGRTYLTAYFRGKGLCIGR